MFSFNETFATKLAKTVDLTNTYNCSISDLKDCSEALLKIKEGFNREQKIYWGLPFDYSSKLCLINDDVNIKLTPTNDKYIVFLHTADYQSEKNYGYPVLGDIAATYILKYDDGTQIEMPIRRRFEIGEPTMPWGEYNFLCVPYGKPHAIKTNTEQMQTGEIPTEQWGISQQRVVPSKSAPPPYMYLYAMENPHTDKKLVQITLKKGSSPVLLFAITLIDTKESPIVWQSRKKCKSKGTNFDIDLGTVISITPSLIDDSVIVEYSAHEDAVLHFDSEIEVLPEQNIDVTIKVVEKGSTKPVPVRIHIHGTAGEYIAPVNRNRIPNPNWFEDFSPDYVNGNHFSTYIDGTAKYKLPKGKIFVEINKGFEIKPIFTEVIVTENTKELIFELEKVLKWRENGWITSDTHVHFLSPQTALLEGEGEGVNVVNLLATQLGELMTNVGDFDGKSNIGNNEYMVRVGTENRQHILGHISLLGYEGDMILPLTTGGPYESALGDPVEVGLTEWAEKCKKQNGLVIFPHFPQPKAEMAATIVSGLADGVELASPSNLDGGISPYALTEWYKYLNCGYHIAAVGGTDKMSARTAVGKVRTYAKIINEPFSYDSFKRAVENGYTFVTNGPLIEFYANGKPMGSKINLPKGGGNINFDFKAESCVVEITKTEIVVNGSVVGESKACEGYFNYNFMESGWAALRVYAKNSKGVEIVAAHSSAIMFPINGKLPLGYIDSLSVLCQIEGTYAYIESLGTKAEADKMNKMLLQLTSAKRLLHNRMHNSGVYHNHTPVDNHKEHKN